jgi:hypothetical protein
VSGQDALDLGSWSWGEPPTFRLQRGRTRDRKAEVGSGAYLSGAGRSARRNRLVGRFSPNARAAMRLLLNDQAHRRIGYVRPNGWAVQDRGTTTSASRRRRSEPVWRGGQGRGRTADLPIFSVERQCRRVPRSAGRCRWHSASDAGCRLMLRSRATTVGTPRSSAVSGGPRALAGEVGAPPPSWSVGGFGGRVCRASVTVVAGTVKAGPVPPA